MVKPWKHINADFVGLFNGKTYSLVMDAYSKWPEIVELNLAISQRAI